MQRKIIRKVFENAKGCQNKFPGHFLYPEDEGGMSLFTFYFN